MDEQLYDRVKRTIAAILRHPVTHPDVEDGAHDVVRRVLEHTGSAAEAYEMWVLGIARHVAIDRIRARMRERTLPLPSDAVRPDGDAHVELRNLQARIAELPGSQRDALLMFHLDGKSYQAIASELNTSMGTVATWISRARQALITKMEER